MDPRVKVALILLVGTAIGAVVAGGAISYVNGSGDSGQPASESKSAASETAVSEGEIPADESAAQFAPSTPRSREPETDPGRTPLFSTDGPAASITPGGSSVPPPKPTKVVKKPTPVVEEEEGDAPKVSDSDGKDDGGSIR